MQKDVFVQSCGWAVLPCVGFMVMGSGCLCRTLVMVRSRLASGAPASRATPLGGDWADPLRQGGRSFGRVLLNC